MASRIRAKEKTFDFEESSRYDQFAYIEVNLTKQDTLNSLSMKFNCTIPDLKRLNSLQNDRDMYALNSLKVPIKKHSTLAHEYANQLKYGDPNLSRLRENAVLDVGLEREIYKNSEEDDSEDALSSVGTGRQMEYTSKNETDSIAETQFSNEIDTANGDVTDNLVLLQNESHLERTYNETQANKTIIKDAKRFFRQKDKELNSLKNKNEEITNNLGSKSNSLTELLIPVSNLSIESDRMRDWNNNHLNIRDVLLVVCFLVVIVPLSIFIYRLYYNNEV